MVMESLGTLKYGDKGNMTKAEIDKTVAFLIETKKSGQFRAFWKSFDESVNLMASGEVIIQSMWSPAVAAVRSKGIACKYQPLAEGYRAWAGGLGLAKHLSGLELDAAYEYINWYLSGWVGAYLNRQGYYSAVLETAKENMTPDEWGYWMEGKPAQKDILSPEGKVMEKAGAVRDGGSFTERMSRIACWNSVMTEDRYMVQKWNEFIAATWQSRRERCRVRCSASSAMKISLTGRRTGSAAASGQSWCFDRMCWQAGPRGGGRPKAQLDAVVLPGRPAGLDPVRVPPAADVRPHRRQFLRL